jgi:hypothetical protein
MAIELHHLNTHGMMEQAGNVLDGVVRLKARIAELEEERRWRKCSEELPEEGVEVLVTNGIDCGISDWCGDYWNNDPFCGYTVCDNVIAWMPLPKAPEVK